MKHLLNAKVWALLSTNEHLTKTSKTVFQKDDFDKTTTLLRHQVQILQTKSLRLSSGL
jgi:hypothetical protein